MMTLDRLDVLERFDDHKPIVARHIEAHSRIASPLNILEAGCGRGWPFRSANVSMTLTGIDADPKALAARQEAGDLDVAILGDLREVSIPDGSFDIIYSRFVLEHIRGAEEVLDKFVRWLKPGGLLILIFPDRDSVYSFFTRITPFYVHQLFKKYIAGERTTSTAGFGPYPTYNEKVTSRRNFVAYCRKRMLSILAEHGFNDDRLPYAIKLFSEAIERISLRRLSGRHVNLVYIVKKGAA